MIEIFIVVIYITIDKTIMEINLIIDAPDASEDLTESLQEWLQDEEDLEGLNVKRKRKELAPDEAGGALLEVLTLALSAPVVVALVKSIHVWMEQKTKRQIAARPRLKLTFEKKDGSKISIDTTNASDWDKKLIDDLTMLLKEEEGKKSEEGVVFVVPPKGYDK